MHQFEKTLLRHGETLQLLTDSSPLPFKASLIESTKATYSVNNRANFFQGQSFKHTLDGTKLIDVGEYFTRESDNNSIYFVMSTVPEPICTDLLFLYAVRCNTLATITRYREEIDPEDETQIIKSDIPIATDIWVNKDIVPRSLKDTNDGLLDQTIYTLSLPRKYGIRLLDKVHIGNGIYQVESINDTLINTDMTGGIDMLQLTYLCDKVVDDEL